MSPNGRQGNVCEKEGLSVGKLIRKNEEMRCTMKGRMLFISNPRSGKGQIRNKLMDIIDVFDQGRL